MKTAFLQDVTTTTLQVCSSGTVPCPARVGRDDVASLAVAAAMFSTPKKDDEDTTTTEPFHYTLACRWVGQELDPFPSQGRKADGLPDAQSALQRALKTIYKADKRSNQRKEALQRKQQIETMSSSSSSSIKSDVILKMATKLQRERKRPQLHGVCVAIPVYFFLVLMTKTLVYPLLHVVPGGKAWILPALYRLKQSILTMCSFVLGHIMMALPTLARRKQYIRL
jgi:hypothetical protein